MKRTILIGSLVALSASWGCAERYPVASRDLMRGVVVKDVFVRTIDGYEYHFDEGAVQGDQFVGRLMEEVEQVDERGRVYVANEVREVELPLGNVVEVEGIKRQVSPNTIYVAGAVGVGALVYAAVSGTDVTDARPRATGNAIKGAQ